MSLPHSEGAARTEAPRHGYGAPGAEPHPPAGAAPQAPSRGRGIVLMSVGALVVAGLAVAGIVPRMRSEHALAAQAQEKALPSVKSLIVSSEIDPA